MMTVGPLRCSRWDEYFCRTNVDLPGSLNSFRRSQAHPRLRRRAVGSETRACGAHVIGGSTKTVPHGICGGPFVFLRAKSGGHIQPRNPRFSRRNPANPWINSARLSVHWRGAKKNLFRKRCSFRELTPRGAPRKQIEVDFPPRDGTFIRDDLHGTTSATGSATRAAEPRAGGSTVFQAGECRRLSSPRATTSWLLQTRASSRPSPPGVTDGPAGAMTARVEGRE